VTDALRFAGGWIVLKEHDDNPFVSEADVATSPFVSASLDFELRRLLGAFGSTLFP
jgi:hypothetical protein